MEYLDHDKAIFIFCGMLAFRRKSRVQVITRIAIGDKVLFVAKANHKNINQGKRKNIEGLLSNNL